MLFSKLIEPILLNSQNKEECSEDICKCCLEKERFTFF
jgi:hypothetical protein